MTIKANLMIIALLSLASYIASTIFIFFGVPTSTYIIYLLYAYVLGIWNATLPEDPVGLFKAGS